MKRVLSVLLAVCLLLTVSVGAVSAEGEAELISVVSFYDLPDVAVGDEIVTPTLGISEEVPYTATAEWYEDDGSFDEPITGTFEDGKAYWLYITVTAKEGYVLDEENAVYVVLGDDAYFQDPETAEQITIEIRYSFLEQITEVAVSGAPEAVVGEKASVEGITIAEDANYALTDAYWMDLDAWETVENGTVFENKHAYRLVIELTPNTGYEFADEVTVMLDGEEYFDYSLYYDYVEVYTDQYFYEEIDEIELPAYPEAEAGDVAGETDYDMPLITADEYIVYGGWFILDEYGATEMFVGELEKGAVYFYAYMVEPNVGYTVTADTVIKIGDTEANGAFDQRGDGWAMLMKLYNFDGAEEIAELELTFTEPVIGEAIDEDEFTPPEDAPYTIETAMVAVSDDEDILNADLAEGVYEEGKYYHYIATVTVKEGYIFSDDLTVTLNGEAVDLKALAELLGGIAPVTPMSLVFVHTEGPLTVVESEPEPEPQPEPTPEPEPEPEPQPEPTPEPESEPKPEASPDTGSTLPMTAAAVLLISAATAFVLKKKRAC